MPVTKEDLEKKIAELSAINQELQQQLNARDAILSKTGEEGWLVTTPVSTYSGTTLGVPFVNGRAFVLQAQPDSERLVLKLVNDFGYSAKRMSGQDFAALAPVQAQDQKASAMLDMVKTQAIGG